ncbi:gamma-glutamylcyclotransferase family protein [Streptomyces goshikiensis]|uniref:gamma-glutamylcyclotransferase family protein n=1 Tax=Streptomyces goshikiensis TaxID=1942 RepID=UPI0036983743
MATMQEPTTQIARRPTRSARLAAGDALFCYGTLQFDAVLNALLSRIPQRHPDSAPGWRTAALEGRQYPGLVTSTDTTARGLLLTDLTLTEWGILDAFEDTLYDLREVALASGRRAWAYVWTKGEVLTQNWDQTSFERKHLPEYAARCARMAPALAAGVMRR